RLQVEHPVTELITSLDLVRWQILVAEGRPLPLTQNEIPFSGHAIEARVYAEDPANGFLPATGSAALWREPSGEGVRVDAGIVTNDTISPYYDPMLAKISAHGADRAEALRKLDRALARTTLFGVRNNLAFLRRVLLHPEHVAGRLSTAFIERHAEQLFAPETPPLVRPSLTVSPGDALRAEPIRPALTGSAVGDALRAEPGLSGVETAALVAALARQLTNPDHHYWRNNVNRPIIERFGADESGDDSALEVRLIPRSRTFYHATLARDDRETTVDVVIRAQAGTDIAVEISGHLLRATALATDASRWEVKVGDVSYRLSWRSPLPEPDLRAGAAGSLAAPMPGQVLAVLVAEGQTVAAGDPLLLLEAMKMEHTVRAPADGIVTTLHFRPGDQVPAGAVLLDLRQRENTEL
ncbi:MAG: biotin/lipoyl-containing protein, partial [Ktedonobacterales bacterium]